MNFEERKAEIFRRSDARIAKRKRNRRIALGVCIPVAVLVIALPFALNRGGLETTPGTQMMAAAENAPAYTATNEKFTNATKDGLASVPVQDEMASVPTTSPDTGELSFQKPPQITVFSGEGPAFSVSGGYFYWEYTENGMTVCSKASPVHPLDPKFPRPQFTTETPTVTLDTSSALSGWVVAEAWPVSSLGDYDAKSLPVTVNTFPNPANWLLTHDLHQVELLPGEYLYKVTIRWPQGQAFYCFQANYEE